MSFKAFKTSEAAVKEIDRLYKKSVDHLRREFESFAAGKIPKKARFRLLPRHTV